MAEFVFKLKSNELITFDSWEDIPEDFEFVHLIKFLPDPPPEPHSDHDHAEADMWNGRLQELMKKERAYASNL